MRFLHTADWHLGRDLRGYDLIPDQAHALRRLEELAASLAAEPAGLDAIVVAGDLYDKHHPAPAAVALLGDAFARLSRIAPVLAISGNHDHTDRVGYAAEALAHANVHIAGQFQWPPKVVHLASRRSGLAADFVLIPYFEPPVYQDVLGDEAHGEASHEACWQRLSDLWPAAVADGAADGHVRIVVAHAFITDGEGTPSERALRNRAVVGGAETVAASTLLGGWFHYGALGHLHKPQANGPDQRVRYPGSLLAYSVDEGHYDHGALVVEFTSAAAAPSIDFRPIEPRRRVVILEGTAEEIRAKARQLEPVRRDDYVLIRFPSADSRVGITLADIRALLPNTLGMEIAVPRSTTAQSRAMQTAEADGHEPDAPQQAAPPQTPADLAKTYLDLATQIVGPPQQASAILDQILQNIGQPAAAEAAR